jgi:hypothetical protein
MAQDRSNAHARDFTGREPSFAQRLRECALRPATMLARIMLLQEA